MPDIEARIIVTAIEGGKKSIKVVDPKTGRESDTGLTCFPGDDLDGTIRRLKATLERAGNHVTVVFK